MQHIFSAADPNNYKLTVFCPTNITINMPVLAQFTIILYCWCDTVDVKLIQSTCS